MKKIDLDEIRKIQLDILIQVDKFCREHKLRYSLGYGTLIGAVRHKGFIPWDDDIDIMMPRPDYERFLKEFEKTPPLSHLAILNYRNNDITPITWTKVTDSRTIIFAPNRKAAVFIDIFPIDGAPEDEKVVEYVKETYKRRCYVMRKRRSYKYGKNILKRYIKYIGKQILYPKSREWAIREYEEYVHSYPFDTSPNTGLLFLTINYEMLVMPAGIFKNYRTIEFEGHEFMCISDYDTCLRNLYGDYMKFPPKEKQVRGHDYPTFWLEKD